MGKDTLTGLKVKSAMRRQLVMLNPEDTIESCIQYLIKYKVNAVLVGEGIEKPLGVVSKTDIMGAWYAGLPLETTAGTIMNSPPLFCSEEDSLDSALDTMKTSNIYRLYAVRPDGSGRVSGALAYPDIVGLLYHYCSRCDQALFNRKSGSADDKIKRYQVSQVMTENFEYCREEDTLEQVVETLSASRKGAVLIADDQNFPKGVISKTDIILCCRHGCRLDIKADKVMSRPVAMVRKDAPVESAIKTMILKDLHRLFVVPRKNQPVCGIISLADAARIRSGSCHACMSSRIKVDAD